ncbi:MAG: DUF6384 family protein [Gammaproteobacteria bacterium]|nr:DUF6384 family protein [Gammaproteobacteria bacterium]
MPEAASTASEAPLEDVMVAMDVVDTVRHRQLIVDRELDADARRQRLLARLRDIYKAQGIEVSDAALEEGVDALEKERFKYTPSGGGFATAFARLYVRRRRWSRVLRWVLGLALIIAIAWYLMVYRPQAELRELLPRQIEHAYDRIALISKSESANERALALKGEADRAIANEQFDKAQGVRVDMLTLFDELQTSYQVRIVSRPNELSGVWRVPAVNPNARNYYLIVEAFTSDGERQRVRVRNEEDGRYHTVASWGLRVDEETFEAVAADKRDDGIIQDDIVGSKPMGMLDPKYRIPTSGATITDW